MRTQIVRLESRHWRLSVHDCVRPDCSLSRDPLSLCQPRDLLDRSAKTSWAAETTKDRDASIKLFYSPGACSLSPHIVLEEAGMTYEAIKTDLKTKQTANGADYKQTNPLGYVPALVLGDGT